MPLPPAPTKRAALLSSDAYDAPARSSSKKPTRKPADRRQSDLAAIHIAQKALALTKEDSEALKLSVTGKASAADMTLAQRRQYLAHLSGLQAQRAGSPKPAYIGPRRELNISPDDPDNSRRAKAQALWHALAVAGHVRIDSHYALMAYVERQTKCTAWRFLNGYQINQVLEALKRWCIRVGVKTS